MLSEITYEQFLEWQAYYELEPFGEKRADWRNGVAISTILNVGWGVRPKMKPNDFIMDLTKTDEQKAKEAADNFDAFVNSFGKKVD